jgi:hypothetical protein
MNRSVFWALVRKDLYLMRGLMVAGIAAGFIGFFLMRFGSVGFAVGGILYITASMASGIFIAMLSILTDRMKNSRLFALSLPISGSQFGLAKLVSAWLAYGIPWLVLTALALFAFLVPEEADRGMVVYAVLLQGFVLVCFALIVATLYVIKSDLWIGPVILFINIGFSLFMVKLNQPVITQPLRTDAIVWTPFAQAMLAGEALALIVSTAFVLFVNSRDRDYV